MTDETLGRPLPSLLSAEEARKAPAQSDWAWPDARSAGSRAGDLVFTLLGPPPPPQYLPLPIPVFLDKTHLTLDTSPALGKTASLQQEAGPLLESPCPGAAWTAKIREVCAQPPVQSWG